MKVIVIFEECHGFIGVAKNIKSAFDFLLYDKWITEKTYFPIEVDNGSDFVMLEDLRKKFKCTNLLDTLVFMWKDNKRWFEDMFSFYTEDVYEST